MLQNKKNYLSTAKGIGIIIMVMGHCGVPDLCCKFIYEFHMPLFFFCSGYFLKNIEKKDILWDIFKKRFKNIYIKFVCWSLLFLTLHNLFFRLNIYNDIVLFRGQPSYLYNTSDFVNKAIRIITSMNEYELLIRSFWFLKQLFLACIIVSTIIYTINRVTKYYHSHLIALLILILLTFISKLQNWSIPAIWDISLVFMSSSFYLSGYIFKKYDILNKLHNLYVSIVCLSLLLVGLFILPWTNMLEYTTESMLPFFITAYSGTILTLNISRKLETSKLKNLFYYLGQNTMVIFALHMLCFKIGNLIKITIYDMPIYRLADFQIIKEHNSHFWIVYTIIGISIPLLFDYIMKNRYTHRIWSFFV
jgi:fucose 4-O-acetylase-like acetyltransferase